MKYNHECGWVGVNITTILIIPCIASPNPGDPTWLDDL